MELAFHIGWDLPSAWTKHGRLRKAWWFHAWCGREDVIYRRFTMGLRVLGFEIGLNFDF